MNLFSNIKEFIDEYFLRLIDGEIQWLFIQRAHVENYEG